MNATDPYRPPEVRVEDVGVSVDATRPARRFARLAARILDAMIYIVPAVLLAFVFGGGLDEDGPSEAFLLLLLGPMALVLIANLYLLSESGQSMGKKALGIKIVRGDGTRASLGRIFVLRMLAPTLAGGIPIAGPIFGLVDPLFIFRDDRRCIHDWMADTQVIEA